MKDFRKATPRPWRFIERSNPENSSIPFGIEGNIQIGSVQPVMDTASFPPNNKFVLERQRVDAELIVTAVNNFDKMKEAIESMLSALNQTGSGIPWNCDIHIELAYQKCRSVLSQLESLK